MGRAFNLLRLMIGELAKMTYTCPHLEHSSLMRAPNGPEPVLVLYGGDMQIHTHMSSNMLFLLVVIYFSPSGLRVEGVARSLLHHSKALVFILMFLNSIIRKKFLVFLIGSSVTFLGFLPSQ